MKQLLINEISEFKNKFTFDQKIFNKFIKFIQTNEKLTKKDGNSTHLGAFFLPINKKSKSIYLVNHIKAQMWIPPGGHVEKNELPINTVKREFKEELNHQLTTEEIKLFNLSVTPINRPQENCIIHFDFWYFIEIERLPFNFLKKEFYHGDWFDFNTALKKISCRPYQIILKRLIKRL